MKLNPIKANMTEVELVQEIDYLKASNKFNYESKIILENIIQKLREDLEKLNNKNEEMRITLTLVNNWFNGKGAKSNEEYIKNKIEKTLEETIKGSNHV
jgi:hypothetical protein